MEEENRIRFTGHTTTKAALDEIYTAILYKTTRRLATILLLFADLPIHSFIPHSFCVGG